MADFYQRDGEFPRLFDEPIIYELFESPEPITLFRQAEDDFPRRINVPEIHEFNSPTPYLIFAQRDDKYDGFPYLNFPKMYEIFTKPLPYIYFHPNKAKKKQYTIIVSNYSEKITVPDYRFEVIGKYPSMKRGDLI